MSWRTVARVLAAMAVVASAGLATPSASARTVPATRPAAATGATGGSDSQGSASEGSGSEGAGATPSAVSPLPASVPGAQLQVVQQSPWVTGPRGVFTLDLRSGGVAPTATLRVDLFPHLTSRLIFDGTLRGNINSEAIYSQTFAASSLPTGAGDMKIELPVNPNSTPATGSLPRVYLGSQNGVYPIRVGLADPSTGQFVGTPIVTYLVWVPAPTDFPKLNVSWVLPVSAAPALSAEGVPTELPQTSSTILGDEVAELANHPSARLSLQITPQTLAALASGGSGDQATLSTLTSVLAGGDDQVLPAPYVNLDDAAMEAAGLASEVDGQFASGASALQTLVGATPQSGGWAADGPLDAVTATGLVKDRSVTDLVVPDGDLSALPAEDLFNTFAQPTVLSGVPGQVKVVGADAALSQHFADTGDQVLEANQFLAELAMIDTEQPGDRRGVAVLVPPGWTPQATFLATALSGLEGNPLLQPVTIQQLFTSVPVAGSPGQTLARSLVSPRPTSDAVANVDAGAIQNARNDLDAYMATFPTATTQAQDDATRLLVAQSDDLPADQRDGALGGPVRHVDPELGPHPGTARGVHHLDRSRRQCPGHRAQQRHRTGPRATESDESEADVSFVHAARRQLPFPERVDGRVRPRPDHPGHDTEGAGGGEDDRGLLVAARGEVGRRAGGPRPGPLCGALDRGLRRRRRLDDRGRVPPRGVVDTGSASRAARPTNWSTPR